MTRSAKIYFLVLTCLLTLSAQAKDRKTYDESIESTRKFDLLGGPSREGPEAEWDKVQKYIQRNRLKKAIKHAGYLTKAWPDSPLAVDAQRTKGDLYFAREDYPKAFDAYQGLIDNYVGSFVYAEVLRQQLECARKTENHVYRALFGLTSYKDPEDAIPLYRQLLTNAPHMAEAPQILFDMGEIYLREHKPLEAINEFKLVEQRYPDSALSEKAVVRTADAYKKLSKRNPTDIRSVEGELSTLNHFIARYPKSESIDDIRQRQKTVYEKLAGLHYKLGEYYENILRRPDAALVTFRSLLQQFPDSEWTGPSRERILDLSQKAN